MKSLRSLLTHIRRNPAALIGVILLGLQIVAIVFAPLLATHSPTEADPISSLQPPSFEHWLGTDVSGMDIYSRIIYATRINLLISISAVALAFVLGVPIGLLIGYYRGFVSSLIMRLFDFIQSFPVFVLGMALVSVMGQEIWNVAIVLAVLFTPMFARLIRAEVLSLRERPFISAARCSGATDFSIMFQHILPNALTPAIVQVSISIGMAILLTAGLSFIGAGVRMPTPEWGLMVSSGAQQMILGVWWVSLFPGLAIVISVLCFALLGDAEAILCDLSDRLATPNPARQQPEIAAAREAVRSTLPPLRRLHAEVLAAIRAALPPDGIVMSDMTQIAYAGNALWRTDRPRTWHHPHGYGTLGFALPAAIGAKLAKPGCDVVCLIGDGGLMFTLQELMTSAELDMPLAIVMWNNDGYAQIRDGMIQRGIPEIGVSLKNPDHHLLAKAMGCLSLRADTPAALTEALRQAFKAPCPTLIEVRQDSFEP